MPSERGEEPARPDPDALLAASRAEGRGRLKVFLGAAPGVGKTYAMLEAARRRKAEGVDVIIGIVETHGRAETVAMVAGLETLPRRRIEYRGQVLEEFDLDAALARRPRVLLVDELAHSNAPGSRHPKRWQDVEELLAAGIDVDTTLNVQHIESLNDVVAQITRIRVRETLPDVVLERADDIELVDLTPEELLQRLAEGKVYVPENARRAVRHYFQPGNLTALRELALRRTAERVDAQMLSYMQRHAIGGPWPAGERIMVCISPDPDPSRLVRAARRLADRAHAPWTAVTVETPGHARMSEPARDRVTAALRLAEHLGGATRTLPGSDLVAELLRFARNNNVTQIVIGKRRRKRLRELLTPSLVHELIRTAEGISIHVVPEGDGAAPARSWRPRLRPEEQGLRPYAVSTLFVAVAAVVAHALDFLLDLQTLSLVFLVAVLCSATLYGLAPAVLSAVLGMLAYNFFFIPPLYTLTVDDPENLLTLSAFLVVAIITSNIAGRSREQALAARRRYKTTAALYDFSRKLAGTRALDDLLWVICHQVATMLPARVVVLMPADDALAIQAGYPPEDRLADADWAAANWAWRKAEAAGLGTGTLPNAERHYVPARTAAGVVAVIGVQPERAGSPLSPDAGRLLAALTDQAAIAIERARLDRETADARVIRERERLHAALLSSISHDLRTPLASIIGATTGLMAHGASLDEAGRRELLKTVHDEARRLDRFVGNLLDMTKLESGVLEVKHDWVDVADVVGTAVARARPLLGERKLELDVASGLPLLRLDHVLFEQVLFNLLDNAAKYGPPGRPVRVEARRRGESVEIVVSDEGPGIPATDLERVFDKFYRVRAADRVVAGTGLGLSICRGLVEAQGGTIVATSPGPSGSGTAFTIRLPIPDAAAAESAA